MKFQALGPLAVYRDDDAVDLGSPKQKAVLALLLMHANQPVSADRIIEEIWGDDSDGKSNALRVYVSRLRSALEPDRGRGGSSVLETSGTGYRLAVEPDRFDVARFEQELDRARPLLGVDPAGAAQALASALSLWQGPAYADFAYDDFAQVERVRLHEARIVAYEDRIESDLARGLSGELVSELEVLRDEHPLRERLVGHQALALYRSGRPADALRAIDRFRRHLAEELGIDPSPNLLRLEEQILLHDPAIQPRHGLASPVRPKTEVANPFKGLRAFTRDDAPSFFGRNALVAELLRVIGQERRLVAVVGASGSGKSSVVNAGLLPALAKGAVAGSDQWLVANMLPGAHPFAELEGALLRTVIDPPDSLEEQLRDGDAGLVRAALRILPDNDSHLLLVIDQFEELFTLVDDEAVRRRFLSNLVGAVDDPYGRITVVLTLRADFYGRPLQHPEFGARLGTGVVNVTPMTAEELEEAALEPTRQVGVGLEPALLGQLISDVGNQPSMLPLFQYALTELFDRRDGDTLVASSYRAMGGVEGALQRRAADLHEQLEPAEQEAARQLFLRLVTVSEHDQRTRRRVAAREIASLVDDTVTMYAVLKRFGDRRLLSFDADPLTGAPTVEVAHESLLTAWPTLVGWIDDGREDLRRHVSLTVAVREWQLADHNPTYLMTGARLSQYEAWSRTSRLSLNATERAFLDAGSDKLAEERGIEEQLRRREARSRRRMWGLVGVMAGALGIAGLLLAGVFASEPTEVMFFANRLDDQWFANVGSGLDRAERELDVDLVDISWAVDPVAEFRQLAASGTEFIVVSDDVFLQLDRSVLTDHPDVRFGVVEGTVGGANVTSVEFANEEGAFLAGVAAASKSETGIVGFIGGRKQPNIEAFRAGFEAGVHSVDPETEVLAVYVDQFDQLNGFGRPDLGEARAEALYQRGADVLFAAAGTSGLGMFTAAVDESEALGRDLWAIGIDNDQWYEAKPEEQLHVLTSIVKRGDLAAYDLVEHMLNGGPAGVAFRLGLAKGGFTYSTQGDALTPDIVARLEGAIADVSEGLVTVPTVPTGPTLTVDYQGNEIVAPRGIDGLDLRVAIEPGTYEVDALGVPITINLGPEWWVLDNIAGATGFGQPESTGHGDREVWFFRPTLLADPTQPEADVEDQVWWPLNDIGGWLETLVDGIVTRGPEQIDVGGRSAVYFEAEVTDPGVCGPFQHCAGFVINTFLGPSQVSAWSFEPGVHHRVWWIDGGDHPPLVIIAADLTADQGFGEAVDELLEGLVVGEFGPHPVDAG
jgi:basic membrane lipoprotein Med (substrate-binding protein (PBP1-ABC) superfamily)/DNA-binding SARP family transcriptional activator